MMRHEQPRIRRSWSDAVSEHAMPADAWMPAAWWVGEKNLHLGPKGTYSVSIHGGGVTLQGHDMARIAADLGAEELAPDSAAPTRRVWLAKVRRYGADFPVWIVEYVREAAPAAAGQVGA